MPTHMENNLIHLRTTLCAAAFAVCAMSAHAAGPYDGIYADSSAANSYISVHTNGDQMIVTQYEIVPASGVLFTTPFGTVTPRQINTWQLLQGTLNGNTATLSGQLLFNQCNVRLLATFSTTGLTANITNASSSGAGTSSTVSCPAITAYNPIRFTKVF